MKEFLEIAVNKLGGPLLTHLPGEGGGGGRGRGGHLINLFTPLGEKPVHVSIACQ